MQSHQRRGLDRTQKVRPISTIPDRLYDRLANACITHEDGVALIALLERIEKSMQSSQWAAESIGPDLDLQAHWRLGAWELVADQYGNGPLVPE